MEEDQDSETISLVEYDEKPEKPMEQINMTINQNTENQKLKEINEKKPKPILQPLPSLNSMNKTLKSIPLMDVRRMSRGVTINQNNPMRLKAKNPLLQLFIVQANIENFLNSMLREYPENQYIISEISAIKVNNDNYFSSNLKKRKEKEINYYLLYDLNAN